MHSFEDAKIQGGNRATGVRPGKDVDVSDGEQHGQEEPSATTRKEQKTSKSGNSVHSGPNKNITDSVKDGPFSNQTTDSFNAKSGPKMKHTSKKAPGRNYYKPSNDTKTFQINNKGHLQCLQDPNLIHKPNGKGKLPGSREAPIYHSVMQDCGGFEETIPQLIRQTWQFEGSLQHQGGPHSQASNTCQKEGANRIKGDNRQGTGLLDRRGNHQGASRANTVGLLSDIPEETKRRSKGMSGSKQLEQGHHQRAP